MGLCDLEKRRIREYGNTREGRRGEKLLNYPVSSIQYLVSGIWNPESIQRLCDLENRRIREYGNTGRGEVVKSLFYSFEIESECGDKGFTFGIQDVNF